MHSSAIRAALLIALAVGIPAPSATIPTTAPALASSLRADERALDSALARWEKSQPAPREVTLRALYRQRVMRLLAQRPSLARAIESSLPSETDDVAARTDLTRLAAATPPLSGKVHLGRSAPPLALLSWYRVAEARFGIHWEVLAAINFVESAFGKVRNVSSAGAQGPMQFEPATWREYGLGGDVHSPHDAILGAAHLLAANGGARHERDALLHYNDSTLYVDAIEHYARRMAHDRNAFFEYYNWQVYVRTTNGWERVTGPSS